MRKNITTLGEGGMIYVKNNNLASKVPGLRHNGHCDFKIKRKNYWQPAMGNLDIDIEGKWPYKFTLSEVQSGAGIVMLKKLKKLNGLRIKRAKKIIKSLNTFKEINFTSFFKIIGMCIIFYQLTISQIIKLTEMILSNIYIKSIRLNVQFSTIHCTDIVYLKKWV